MSDSPGTKPWVSILTPLYNGVEFLKEAAMSVFLQQTEWGSRPTGEPQFSFTWEWILGINGHGPDGGAIQTAVEALVRGFQQSGLGHHGVVRVLNFPNVRGKVATLNTMVEYSKGGWIALLDVDDTWERTKLITQYCAVQARPEIDVLGTHCYYFGDIVSPGPTLPAGEIRLEDLDRSNPLLNSSVILKRKWARWEDRFGLEDYDLWYRLALRDAKLYNLPHRLLYHRLHAASAFNGKGRQDVEGLRAWHRPAVALKGVAQNS
jgi:glycosyltransferase involved in cell wall biosynthesis